MTVGCGPIRYFQGEWRWLSNFWSCFIYYERGKLKLETARDYS